MSTENEASGAFASIIKHILVGVCFGVVVTKAEVISWFRIQEMFRFQAIHMYGVIGGAVVVAGISLFLIRRWNLKTLGGEEIHVEPKDMGRGYRVVVGGTIFGIGWGLTGACPGPIFALIGNGISVMVVVLLSALAGTWAYGHLRDRLPH